VSEDLGLVHITPNFTWAEFESHDGKPVPDGTKPNVRRLCLMVLEPIRKRWGKPVVVVSGYRSPEHNKRVGGAKKSKHVLGEAADVRPVEMGDVPHFLDVIESMVKDGSLPTLGGYGKYLRWAHVDVRQRKEDGSLARWTGKGLGSEPDVT